MQQRLLFFHDEHYFFNHLNWSISPLVDTTNFTLECKRTQSRILRNGLGPHTRKALLLDEQLRDLDGVQGGTLAQVVAGDDQHQAATAVDGLVLADTADQGVILAGGS